MRKIRFATGIATALLLATGSTVLATDLPTKMALFQGPVYTATSYDIVLVKGYTSAASTRAMIGKSENKAMSFETVGRRAAGYQALNEMATFVVAVVESTQPSVPVQALPVKGDVYAQFAGSGANSPGLQYAARIGPHPFSTDLK